MMLVYTILDRWTDVDYFAVEHIKERVKNELKIEETGSYEIDFGYLPCHFGMSARFVIIIDATHI
jgi:hypothetical protein